MNPDCPYCGLKDGANIEHTCDPKAMKLMLDNLYREIRRLKDESKPKRPVSKQDILRIALEVGFSISTAYGQESGKLIPISDSKTLERFAQALAEINEGEDK
jgi:hypothetical protein